MLRLILAYSFPDNIVIGNISRVPGPGDNHLKIKYIPDKVMTHFFQANLKYLLGCIDPLLVEDTKVPNRAKGNPSLPQSYCSATLQFPPSPPSHRIVTFPPFGKRIWWFGILCFY